MVRNSALMGYMCVYIIHNTHSSVCTHTHTCARAVGLGEGGDGVGGEAGKKGGRDDGGGGGGAG